MKRLKIGLIATAILAVTAIAAAPASAVVSFESNIGGPLIEAQPTEAPHQLSTTLGTANCAGPYLWTKISKSGAPNLSMTAEDSTCHRLYTKPLSMNGCKLVFHPDYKASPTYRGTFDIGPAGCGPVTTELTNCKVTIPSQTGLDVTYENLTAGAITYVRANVEATGLEYTQSGWCGNTNGTYEDGTYTGSWLLKAHGGNGSGTGQQVAKENHVFSAGGQEVTCGNASFAWSYAWGTFIEGKVTPTYEGCKAFGFLSATVSMNGCQYVGTIDRIRFPSYEGVTGVSCPEGKAIEIKASSCAVSVPAQTGLKGLSGNLEAKSSKAAVTGIEYKVTQDGFLCPFNGTGAHYDGVYTGETTLSNALIQPPGNLEVAGE